jgi:3,4-dihydroxy 2-butanone 4-phosphate synthase/GTP cyclohydrolase II
VLRRRQAHRRRAVDLRLAGLYPAGVLCEVLDEDGSMARLSRLRDRARVRHGDHLVQDLIACRRRSEARAPRRTPKLPARFGEFISTSRSGARGCGARGGRLRHAALGRVAAGARALAV